MVASAPDSEFVFFLDPRATERFDLAGPNVRTVAVAQSVSPTQAAVADGYRSPMDMLRFTRAVAREPLDVFFSPSVYTYFPLPPRLRAVVAIHDAIADRYPELTLPSLRARVFWRAKVTLALWQARLVLTVSDYAAGELVEVLRLGPERIRVAVEAPALEYRPSESQSEIAAAAASAGLPNGARWFVYVGGFNPHKRLDTIVRAHAALAADDPEHAPHLLLVGTIEGDGFFSEVQKIRCLIAEAGTEALVHWTGFVADDELRHLHSGALALLLPSECEGFGLPAVEAAACGIPVVATMESPLPQLLEGGGIFVPPGDDAALAEALRLLAGDELLRRALGCRARERATQLSWTRSADAALGTLREAAA